MFNVGSLASTEEWLATVVVLLIWRLVQARWHQRQLLAALKGGA